MFCKPSIVPSKTPETSGGPEAEDAMDPKRVRVLNAALQAALAYGYHRTTMDDVARAAQMSRPALYLLFKNKTDIFRAVASRMFEQILQRMEEALQGPGTLGERLFTGIDTAMIGAMCSITESPHGAEIMDLKSELAGDLVQNWHNRLSELFRDAIQAEIGRSGVDLRQRGLSTDTLAELLVDGLEGMKMRTGNADAQRSGARQLVRVIELAIER